MDPKAPYWQYGFPAAIICVLGADFAFAVGTLFIAKIALPHEQSVAGAILQTIMALGTSVGLSITTIAEVAGMKNEAKKLGITVASDADVAQIPPSVLFKGYRYAQLAGAAFGVFGMSEFKYHTMMSNPKTNSYRARGHTRLSQQNWDCWDEAQITLATSQRYCRTRGESRIYRFTCTVKELTLTNNIYINYYMIDHIK